MKVLFAALHLAYFRNFESVIRELAARGHQVHLAGDEPEAMGGQALAERLAAEHAGITWDRLANLGTTAAGQPSPRGTARAGAHMWRRARVGARGPR